MTRARASALAAAGLLLAACAWGARPVAAQDTAAPTSPKPTEISYYYDIFDHSLVRPITRALDPALGIRKLTHHPREAINVDENDQVRLPSTWWQPRLGYRAVTVEQMLEGPGPGTGPAPGKWTVTSAKTQGITPGFFMKDSRGDRFLVKFDPPSQPEMASAADVISSHLYWAAGYNVPDNAIATFRREDLEFAPDAIFTDRLGHKRPMSQQYMDQVFEHAARNRDGSFRVMASRLFKGKHLGPFEYRGRRKDDPEDLIPHQHRRELRGLWTLAAWTGHADVRGPNSLDFWVTEGGRSFVRHHLIDFGSCLGSAAVQARSPQSGNEYMVDYGVMARSLLTLGLRRAAWETTVDPQLPSVGFIEAEAFDPGHWKPDYPNPAFDERTERDARWGARIVAGFTDAHIRAAVECGKYSDPRATEYLTRVLIARRDKIVRRWLSPAEAAGVAAGR